MQTGRPPEFNDEIGRLICELTAEGKRLQEVLEIVKDLTGRDRPFDVHTVYQWRQRYQAFDQDYTRAAAIGFDNLADNLLSIHEEVADVQRARLYSDNLKWLLSKKAPAKYGDRLDVNINQQVSIEQALTEARNRATLQRPMRDQRRYEDVQDVEYTTENPATTTDTQSENQPDDIDSLLE